MAHASVSCECFVCSENLMATTTFWSTCSFFLNIADSIECKELFFINIIIWLNCCSLMPSTFGTTEVKIRVWKNAPHQKPVISTNALLLLLWAAPVLLCPDKSKCLTRWEKRLVRSERKAAACCVGWLLFLTRAVWRCDVLVGHKWAKMDSNSELELITWLH